MDLSKMLNADEAGEKHVQRPRPERAYSEQRPYARDDHATPVDRGATHHAPGYPPRPRPLAPLHTASYSPQASHYDYPQTAHPQSSYPHSGYPPVHTKSSSPYPDGQQTFPRQLDYSTSPASRNHSMASGGSPAGQPVSPYGYPHSPAASYQQGVMTPGSRFSEHRMSSQAITASSHGSHTGYAQLESPLSLRSTSQIHPSHGTQPYLQQHPSQQTTYPAAPPRPPVLIHQGSGNTAQEPQRGHDQQQPARSIAQQVSLIPTPSEYDPSFAAPPTYNHVPPTDAQLARVSGSLSRERERSISVSPKTILSTLPPNTSSHRDATPPRISSANSQMSPPSRLSLTTPPSQPQTQITPTEQNKISRSTPPSQPHAQRTPSEWKRMSISTPPSQTSQPSPNESIKRSRGTPPTQMAVQPAPTKATPIQDVPQNAKRPLEDDHATESRQFEPPAKKRRSQAVPIWAKSSKLAGPFKIRDGRQPPISTEASSRQQPSSRASSVTTNTAPTLNGNSQVALQPDLLDNGPLGIWEKSITNIEPAEELTKAIGDFLFPIVVEREDLATGGAGEPPSPNGQLEIEAKIGKIIDPRTKERFRIPILTEAVLASNYDVTFESEVTENQHKNFNAILNDLTQKSQLGFPHDPPILKPRVPIEYVHTRETDRFYELPQSEISNLPPTLKSYLNPHHTPKLRVTLDKSNKILAKIVKVRISDLHVYSPRTDFDWRVSVNLEMDWDGDVIQLMEEGRAAATKQPDRYKDRLSYKHLKYQIDLTQVKQGNDGQMKTHELEIEMASAAVREQGKLAKAGEPNHYMELMKGFADNVRILVRKGSGA